MAGFLDTLFSGGAQKEAAEKNTALYNTYGRQGMGYLTDSYNQGRTDLGQAVKAFDPLSALATKYGAGTDMYLNSLGLKGPEGTAAAQAAFETSPGYNWQREQGEQALERRAAGNYMSGSGNTDMDVMRFNQGLAQQGYGSWQDRLAGLDKSALAATGGAAAGQAGAYGSLADLANMYGQNRTNLTGQVTSGAANSNNMAAAGQAQGAQNVLGAALGIGSMLLSGGTAGFGGSPLAALGGSTGKMFMGGGSPSGY